MPEKAARNRDNAPQATPLIISSEREREREREKEEIRPPDPIHPNILSRIGLSERGSSFITQGMPSSHPPRTNPPMLVLVFSQN